MFDFPAAPTMDQVFEPIPGTKYQYNGFAWIYSSTNTALALTAILPNYLLAGGNDRTLRVIGLGFQPSSVIYMDGNALTTIFASTEELQASILASAETVARVAQITVKNGTLESNALPLNFVLTPVLTSFDPTTISASSLSTVTLTGENFVDGSVCYVNWNEMATTYVSPTTLTAECGNVGSNGDQLYIQVYTGQLITSNQLLIDIVA